MMLRRRSNMMLRRMRRIMIIIREAIANQKRSFSTLLKGGLNPWSKLLLQILDNFKGFLTT